MSDREINISLNDEQAICMLFEGFYQQRFDDLQGDKTIDKNKLRDVYLRSIEIAKNDEKTRCYFKDIENSINEYATLLDYCLGELRFAPEKDAQELASIVFFRYQLLYKADNTSEFLTDNTNYFDPYISTMRCMEHFLYKINRPLAKRKPNLTLVMDISSTIFKKIAGFCKMMNFGLYTDAFVSWRTLHESECILNLLVNGGENIRQSYVEHIAYNNQLRNKENYTQAELDRRFDDMKEVMKNHGLKSKDMKKFIEYGWIYDHPDFNPEDKRLKLNFRDGVERLARLRRYASIYEASSEITHSSSTFFYADDNECKQLALGLTYESFVRIVKLYHHFVLTYFLLHKDDEALYQRLLLDLEKMQKTLTANCRLQIINYPGDDEPVDDDIIKED